MTPLALGEAMRLAGDAADFESVGIQTERSFIDRPPIEGPCCSLLIGGARHYWSTTRLWQLSETLPIKELPLAMFGDLMKESSWFGRFERPTLENFIRHFQRVRDADLSFPIILSAETWLMDGLHRIAKAKLEDHRTILAKQFPVNPPPDFIEAIDL